MVPATRVEQLEPGQSGPAAALEDRLRQVSPNLPDTTEVTDLESSGDDA
jgi:hypothetical protein